MRRRIAALVVAAGLFAPLPAAAQRASLGIFESWGAFRDAKPLRCYAVAVPERTLPNAAWRAFASVSHWPGQNVRGQLHVRLSRAAKPDTPVVLRIGGAKFPLAAGGADSWAANATTDAAIIKAMRTGRWMYVDARDANGRAFTDHYRLPGAATAIDAAALGCARQN